MKSLKDRISESLMINEDILSLWKNVKEKGLNKSKNVWGKIKSLITRDVHFNYPSVVLSMTIGEPDWFERDFYAQKVDYVDFDLEGNKAVFKYPMPDNYDRSKVIEVMEIVGSAIVKATNVKNPKNVVAYVGGLYEQHYYEFDLNINDNVPEIINEIVNECRSNIKMHDVKIQMDPYSSKQGQSIVIEISNDGYFDYVTIDCYM